LSTVTILRVAAFLVPLLAALAVGVSHRVPTVIALIAALIAFLLVALDRVEVANVVATLAFLSLLQALILSFRALDGLIFFVDDENER